MRVFNYWWPFGFSLILRVRRTTTSNGPEKIENNTLTQPDRLVLPLGFLVMNLSYSTINMMEGGRVSLVLSTFVLCYLRIALILLQEMLLFYRCQNVPTLFPCIFLPKKHRSFHCFYKRVKVGSSFFHSR